MDLGKIKTKAQQIVWQNGELGAFFRSESDCKNIQEFIVTLVLENHANVNSPVFAINTLQSLGYRKMFLINFRAFYNLFLSEDFFKYIYNTKHKYNIV